MLNDARLKNLMAKGQAVNQRIHDLQSDIWSEEGRDHFVSLGQYGRAIMIGASNMVENVKSIFQAIRFDRDHSDEELNELELLLGFVSAQLSTIEAQLKQVEAARSKKETEWASLLAKVQAT